MQGAAALQGYQYTGASQLQGLQFQGEQFAQQMGIAQTNLMAQGDWQAAMAIMGGDAMVQQAQFGQLGTMLGIEAGGLAGANAALSSAMGNQMSAMGMQAQMYGSQSQASSGLWGAVAGAAAVKYSFLCIPKGVKIDCVNKAIAIENIKPGDVVIGYSGKPVKVLQKHEYLEDPTEKRFYKVKFNNGSVVDVCDMHKINGIASKDIIEDVAEKQVYDGVEFSYDLLTEDLGYRIDGIPVNSMIEEMATVIANKIKNK